MSDLPDFYHGVSPGYPVSRSGMHLEQVSWAGNIAASSYQCFTWFPFVAYRITTTGATTVTIGDGFGPYFVGACAGAGVWNFAFTQPRTGYLRLSWLDFAATVAGTYLKVEALRRNGTTFTVIYEGFGGVGFGMAGVYYADAMGMDWGPDSVLVRTDARGPQRYMTYFGLAGLVSYYSSFRYELERDHSFAFNTSIGCPNYGFNEWIYNDNWKARAFSRVFRYTWDEVMNV